MTSATWDPRLAQSQRRRRRLRRAALPPPKSLEVLQPATATTAAASPGTAAAPYEHPQLMRLSPRFRGVHPSELGPGDQFEVVRADADRRLRQLLGALHSSRAEAQRLRLAAVEYLTSSASVVDLPIEEVAMVRADAEVARTMQAESKLAGRKWFVSLLRNLVEEQLPADETPAQLFLLQMLSQCLQRGELPTRPMLHDAIVRLTRDELQSSPIQVLLAFLRRLARIPIDEWALLHETERVAPPMEALLQARFDTIAIQASRGARRASPLSEASATAAAAMGDFGGEAGIESAE